ncbi:hypothetical protein OPV22_005483 [Ensete ventricosum]|uniref:Uncharacterized protein n=1 Tax=Ensete ventricosum TaxID=4639 RepID=A0AAV8Q1F7_ENSVE|nr:hypothetical protein OPV22_005483 [Ensete ventricosum]
MHSPASWRHRCGGKDGERAFPLDYLSQSAGHGMPSGIVASIDLSACFISEEEVLLAACMRPSHGVSGKGLCCREIGEAGRTVDMMIVFAWIASPLFFRL